ncbi:hypothetical protein [Rhodopila sp.]|uniref:hypothetical protein n=1 Tax=Rhodopila sp. TaxID=2480087 RepID=UPI003D116BCB
MITDEPDEDANSLDDAALGNAYLDAGSPGPDAAAAAVDIPEWPANGTHDIGFALNPTTLAWFKNNHLDWRREIGVVLNAWVIAQMPEQDASPTG